MSPRQLTNQYLTYSMDNNQSNQTRSIKSNQSVKQPTNQSVILVSNYRSWSSIARSPTIRSVVMTTQWSGPIKSRIVCERLMPGRTTEFDIVNWDLNCGRASYCCPDWHWSSDFSSRESQCDVLWLFSDLTEWGIHSDIWHSFREKQVKEEKGAGDVCSIHNASPYLCSDAVTYQAALCEKSGK